MRVILLALLLPAVSCSTPAPPDCERWAAGDITPAPEQTSCESDDDCTWTSTSCCSCGGTMIAVNEVGAEFVRPPSDCCAEQMACPAVACPSAPVCVGGTCQPPPEDCLSFPVEQCPEGCAVVEGGRWDETFQCYHYGPAYCMARDRVCTNNTTNATDGDGNCWWFGSGCELPEGWQQDGECPLNGGASC